MAQRLWYVRNCSLFQRLSAEQLSRLEQRARIRALHRFCPPRRKLAYAALHGIQQHFERLQDPRFGTIRVLDLLPGDGGIVVAAVNSATLRHVLSDRRRWQEDHPAEQLPTCLRNAGAWLA